MAGWPAGTGRRIYPVLDSTMAEAQRLKDAAVGPVWLLALEQNAARGRRGRAWVQPTGNFSATYLFRPGGTLEARALRSFVAALALRDALAAATGRHDNLSLKWPNDVLLQGGKVAGILLESLGEHLALGIGVNLVAAPPPDAVEPGATRPVSLLAATGARIAPEDFLDLLAAAFARREAEFTTYGFAPIRNAWLAGAARLGTEITARTGNSAITGIFETVDEQGCLVLKASDGRHRIAAADVFF
ncbi:MAG: biotin--[acetyl-CoA-carboxylase] ligase [Rhodobacteraceae bacterium]|nr:biotin--[acetyl-CoA-carboxylase] ligase [Paracoccaceae bacterium]